jgi:hypothetical protein
MGTHFSRPVFLLTEIENQELVVTRQKNTSTPKPKIRKSERALVEEAEEIVVKLDTIEKEEEQAWAELKDMTVGATQLQKEIDELKRINQQIREENETLRKSVQAAEENAARHFETAEKEKRAAERHRLHFESRIRELEKTNSVIDEKPSMALAQTEAALAENISIPKTIFKAGDTPERQKIAAESITQKLPEVSGGSVTIQSVRVFQSVGTQAPALMLTTGEGFAVQTIFHLSGMDALALTNEKAPYQVACYIYNLTEGGAPLLNTCKGQLAESKFEYTINAYLPSLSPGLYRLTTLVTISTTRNQTAHYQGPIVHVR